MPEWMGKFKGVDTAQILSEYSETVWPPICGGCNVLPLDSQPSRCHSCLMTNNTLPRSAEDRPDTDGQVDASKRTRFSDHGRGAGSAPSDIPVIVGRNAYTDVRESDRARGSGQDDRHREPLKCEIDQDSV